MTCFWTDTVGVVEDCGTPLVPVTFLPNTAAAVSLGAVNGNIIHAFNTSGASSTAAYYNISTSTWTT
jgi:hypothetical protein